MRRNVKYVRNRFRLRKENEAFNDGMINDIKKLSELKENYFKQVRVGNCYSNNHTEFEGNSGRYKKLYNI